MAMLNVADKAFGYGMHLDEVARIWKAGCIIRAVFLNSIMQAFKEQPQLENLLLDKRFREAINTKQDAWRRVIAVANNNGIPVPAFSASLAYYDSYRRERLPANLIQAQRDYFGAHTYERIDKPGIFHTEWGAETPAAKSPEAHKQDEARPSQVVKK
jgi:6-phosphogluconate dehydrogenase